MVGMKSFYLIGLMINIICSINSDIPIRIPSHLYVHVNKCVLCNCGIEDENHFLLESLAACHDSNSKLVMYFTVNTAFVNFLDQFNNLTESLELPILKNKTTFKQTLPISLNVSVFDSELLTALRNLKDFIHKYNCKKDIFDLNERHYTTDLITNKNLLFNNYIGDVFLYVTAVISLLVTTLALYLLCKHKKLKMLAASLALQEVKEVGGSNNTGRGHYRMQNSELYNFGINCHNVWSSDVRSATLKKIKAVQRTHVL